MEVKLARWRDGDCDRAEPDRLDGDDGDSDPFGWTDEFMRLHRPHIRH